MATRVFLALTALAMLSQPHVSIAQTSSGVPPVSSDTIRETEKNKAKKGKVILERSTDENGQTVDGPNPAGPAPAPVAPAASVPGPTQPPANVSPQATAQDTERSALTYTDFDLDVRLRPAESRIAVRALVTVRNDSKVPLAHLPLQLSSTLNWELIRVQGRSVPYAAGVLNSDTDHTGQLHEAVVSLPTPLAPGASLQLDVTYSGTVTESAKRLLAIGTPDDVAAHSDWDRIAVDFTGLRGFGNVVWYPVSSVPVILGDGARLFDEIGTHKLRLAGAHFRLALTIE
jgi:hypothetical protein